MNVNTNGNPDIDQHMDPGSDIGNGGEKNIGKLSWLAKKIGYLFIGIFAFTIVGFLIFCIFKRKKNPNTNQHSSSDIKTNMNANDETVMNTLNLNQRDVYVLDAENIAISIQVLVNLTNNFSHENILCRGGFGSVYKGKLDDGTNIAVKRMESCAIRSHGTDKFIYEILVLTKVRHRHLVSLLGYCLEGNERMLVYEYMPQDTLSEHLFNLNGRKPLEWKVRLSIVLDVARGVEYLHRLANQSFIQRPETLKYSSYP
ncbi:hypothetical protein ZOSMA_49G00560 [Zostera marina]|uniref:Protein kinase domain-containing protein n=1 Tax=Zostera marina TaxID=29655 RepID=A0A0K9NZ37_ZOSMR|nr:hypothetical protein ZOSMA_49G00560 [Zostera marina]